MRHEEDFGKNYLPRLGVEVFHAFSHPRPTPGDTFYIGFDEAVSISGSILKLDFVCEETQAVGVRRSDPPWVWECSVGRGKWEEVPPNNLPKEKDTTGGLNNPRGQIIFYLPLTMQPDQVHGRNAYWLRCRLEQRREEQGMYTQSPRVIGLTTSTLGSATRATHAIVAEGSERRENVCHNEAAFIALTPPSYVKRGRRRVIILCLSRVRLHSFHRPRCRQGIVFERFLLPIFRQHESLR